MELDRLARATAAWLDVWRHGSAHPDVIRDALFHLAAQACGPERLALAEHARLVVASVPYGSARPFAA